MSEIVTWDGNPVSEPGLYDMPANAYFGNALPAGLSQSSAKVLLEEGGPARFKSAQELPRVEKKDWDFGTVAHALILGKGDEQIDVHDFPNWMTKAAKEARALSYLEGRTPILTKDYDKARDVAEALPAEIAAMFTGGQAEVSMLWQHSSGLWLRGQMDYYRPGELIVDLKTMADATRWGFEKSVRNFRYYFQAAWYRRMVERLTGERLPYLIVGVEKHAPYLSRAREIDEDYIAIGEAEMDRAIDIYLACVESGEWPGYSTAIEPLSPPSWLAADQRAEQTITELEALIGDSK